MNRDRRRCTIMAAGILLLCCTCAFALNPSLDVRQYAHTAWKVSDGVFKGIVWSIAQTPDGYLWVGTDSGLVRFDGVRSIPWQPPVGTSLPSSDVRTLLAERDGRLWMGTTKGLASFKDGILTLYPELNGQSVEALFADRQGVIWVGSASLSLGRLCAIQSGKTECYGEDGRFGAGVTAFCEDSAGHIWAGAMTGLWRWRPGQPQVYSMPDSNNRINALIESDDGGILVAKDSGITKLKHGKEEPFPLPPEFQPGSLLRDRDGALWIGAIVDSGLLHIHNGRTDLYNHSDGLSSNTLSSLFEDREGNIWVATVDGIDRFREFVVTTLSIQEGLSSNAILSVIAAKDGNIWIATDNGINKWRNGEVTVYRKRSLPRAPAASALNAGGAGKSPVLRTIIDSGLPDDSVDSLFEDDRGQIWAATKSGVAILNSGRFMPIPSLPPGVVFSIAEDRSGSVWLSQREGLYRVREARVVESIPWEKLGYKEPATALLCDELNGGLWLGFRDGSVAYFKEGQLIARYGTSGGVNDLYTDTKGTLWAATAGGLSRIKDSRVLTLTTENGLPCNTVHWMIEGDAGSVWLYMACGLARIPQPELDAWTSQPNSTIHPTVFDSVDGVRSQQFHYGYNAVVTKSADGKLWFVPFGGLSVIDPNHLPINKLPPPVNVEQLTVDGTTYDAANGLRLPAGARDLLFDFAALSFVAPERVRIRVKLEGQDEGWRELINQRHVHYTNLPPRNYRFRVVACNNSGVCNEEGDFLDFSIAPALYQRTSFRALCVIAFFALVFAVYELRVHQIARQFNKTLEARVSERTRIARELHDTLLQAFQGLLLRFQSASNVLPANPHEAKRRLDLAVDQAAAAITEGRNAIQGLRSSAFETNDLAAGIIAIGQELTGDDAAATAPVIDVVVEGATRNLNPIVRDEAYRIAGEALRNAIRHAEARHISIEIRYDRRQFRLRVRDDGKGLDEATLQSGHAGHFGLPGMRERAEIVRGRLEVWSKRDTGTEIELSVPGAVAYGATVERSWFSKVFSGKSRSKESTEP